MMRIMIVLMMLTSIVMASPARAEMIPATVSVAQELGLKAQVSEDHVFNIFQRILDMIVGFFGKILDEITRFVRNTFGSDDHRNGESGSFTTA